MTEFGDIFDYQQSAMCFECIIPTLIDQNPCAQWRKPMDMMRQGCSTNLFHASQQ